MSERDEKDIYIDNFIADLMSGNIEIVYSRAQKLSVYIKEKGILGERKKDVGEFASALGLALTRYLQTINNPAYHIRDSYECIKLIIWANTSQIIKRTGLKNKISELTKENAQLKEEKDKLQKEIARLNLLNEALHEAFDKLGIQRIGKNEKSKNGE
jgi:cell division protein FtsB